MNAYREIALSQQQLLEAANDYAVKHGLVWGDVLEYGKVNSDDLPELARIRWRLPDEVVA